MSFKLNVSNRFQATRPRHLMGNDPRKLVSHYEVVRPSFIGWYAIAGAVVGILIAIIVL